MPHCKRLAKMFPYQTRMNLKASRNKFVRNIVRRQVKQNLFNPKSRFYHTCTQGQRPLYDC